MKRFLHLLFLSFLLAGGFFHIHAGIIEGTEVYIENPDSCNINKKNIEDLIVGDKILTCISGSDGICYNQVSILRIYKAKINQIVFIQTTSGEFLIDPDESLFNPEKKLWMKAKNLTKEDSLCSILVDSLKIEKVSLVELTENKTVYHLTLEDPHIFYIADSKDNAILVHNFDASVPSYTVALVAAAEAAPPAALAITAAYGGYWAFKTIKGIFKHRKKKKQQAAMQIGQEKQVKTVEQPATKKSSVAPPPPEDPDQDKKKKEEELIKESGHDGSEKTLRQLEKAQSSHKKQFTRHEQKLEDYTKNPEKYDNQGLLKNAASEKIWQERYLGRIQQLKTQIAKQRLNYDKITKVIEYVKARL